MKKIALFSISALIYLIIGGYLSPTFASTSQQGRSIINQMRNDGRTDEEIKITMRDLGLDTNDYFPTNSTSYTSNNKSTSSNSKNTSQQGRDILNQLRNEGWTDQEIKIMMEDLGLDTSGYFGSNKSTTNTTTRNSSTVNYNNKNTTQQGRDVLNQLRNEGRTDQEIKIIMEDLGLDTSGYFSNSNNKSSNSESVYTSRSCKVYNIEYINNLGVYTSPNLKKQEYFVNIDYFKRYIDSKNPQKSGCPVNGGYITTFYTDNSNSSNRYTAPNGKVYFITTQNGLYTSNELSKAKSFGTITELKNYIRDRNPLIWMGQNNYK